MDDPSFGVDDLSGTSEPTRERSDDGLAWTLHGDDYVSILPRPLSVDARKLSGEVPRLSELSTGVCDDGLSMPQRCEHSVVQADSLER